jgi:uncharacterized phage protein (TIGR01671 family)
MNKLKFRAWDSIQQVMVHTYDIWSPKDIPVYCMVNVSNLGIIYTQKATDCSHIIFFDSQGKTQEFYNNWDITKIYDKEIELMPSTGKFDVNKVEIFVGDIVKIKIKGYPTPEIGVIEYFDDYCMYSIQEPKRIYQKWVKRPIGKNGSSTKYTPFQWAYSFTSVEIIGNKYENPELCSKN